ncbi:unnamed protein product [Periconia digitata]|uniref:NAD-dependent epimerase/dehydratase domain-containing protein n=1 Tax=Periconia digitata TaxID=1303443 RepID=A0A9W4U1N1_9PLEO|nr:unnamed protein product [Periconia digitata]
MKVIIVGATGFLGSEVLRQALARKDITKVVAVTRRVLAENVVKADAEKKMENVVVKDYDVYDEKAKGAFAGADGCIWTIAITPMRASKTPWEEVVRVCQTSTLVGLRTIFESGPANPFRFLYVSGVSGERDQTKKPWYHTQYCLMRGETESQVLAYAKSHAPLIEATVAKPGLIVDPGNLGQRVLSMGLRVTGVVPSVGLREISKAMLDQVVGGFEKDPLLNADLVRLGAGA